MSAQSLILGLIFAQAATALVSPDGIGRLPAMGWNSWNEYGCNINESVFLEVGKRLVSLGLKDVGYQYVNVDDCWSDKQKRRDPATKEIIPDANKFPQGISHTAQSIHALGLKFGIYSDAGTETCGGYAGSIENEEVDAATFSKWGVDYIKYDNCNVPTQYNDQFSYSPEGFTTNAPENYNWGTSTTAKRYNTMRDALLKQTRSIQFSLCAWGQAHIERWGNATGHSWRMWGDIEPAWKGHDKWSWGIMPIVNQASFFWNMTNFWGHNDWDMLEVGNGNLTIEENRSHFAMWCALKSPLIIGTPLDSIKKPILDILANKELIDFNQDPVYGGSAMPFKWNGLSDLVHPAGYWTGTSVNGIHLFMLNTQDAAMEMRTLISDIPGLKHRADTEYLVHDMWTGKDHGTFKGVISLDVGMHDTAALRITTTNGSHPNPQWTPQ